MTSREVYSAEGERKFLEFLGIPYPYNRPVSNWHPSPEKGKVLVLSDLHCPYEHLGVLALAQNEEHDAEILISPGDVGDYYSKSRFKKTRPITFKEEARAVFMRLQWMATQWPDVRVMIGNHDCLDEKTLCLTMESGWVKHDDLCVGMHALTRNDDGECEWQEIERVFRYDHSGDMVVTNTRGVSMSVTRNHRIYHRFKSENYLYRTANDLLSGSEKRRPYIPVSGFNLNPEWREVSDDEIRFIGWLLTDGNILRNGNSTTYAITQRKSKVHKILEIVSRLGWPFSLYERERNTTQIAGKVLIKKPEVECSVRIKTYVSPRLNELMGGTKDFPAWLWMLSKRQFDIFLSSMIDGDGSVKANGSRMLYMQGLRRCADMQALMACNGYRTSLYPYPNDNWRINISEREFISIDGGYSASSKVEHYVGKVWCVSIPNTNFLVMRQGKVFFTGNSRPEKAISGLFADNTDLLIMTEQNLLKYFASYFDNIQVVGTQLDSTDFILTHIYQFGDCIFTHGELSRAQKTAVLEYISKYLFRWGPTLALKPYTTIAQAHNHQDMKTSTGPEYWFMIPTACDPYSPGIEYIFHSKMIGSPPAVGYMVMHQENGVTNYNRTHNVLVDYAIRN